MADNKTNDTAKLVGGLYFDLTPIEANLRRFNTIVDTFSRKGAWLERRMKELNFSGQDLKGLSLQEKILNVKLKEARVQKTIADAKLKEARTNQINLRVESQRALTQKRLAQAGQAALRTKMMEADLQNKLAAAENKRLQITMQRQKLLQQQQAMEMGMLVGGAGAAGRSGGGGGQNADYTFAGALEHRMGWFASSMAFFGSGMVFSNILEQIGNVEMGMIELARIQDDVNFNFEEMRQELIDLGKQYGQTWEVVQDIALRWSQAGLNTADTIEATKASLLALNTAELDAEQSTTALVGIMSQWGLEATDLLGVIDKINITADNFVVTSQDIVDGLLRSSGAARVLGLSLEETIAMLTAMRSASGRTGREVGNALNSIFSFMQRDTAINTFESLGIDIWADEAKTQFRNVLEIFDQVHARWGEISNEVKDGFVQAADEAGLFNEEFAAVIGAQEEWNDLQKRDVSQSMAGVYRRNYLLALLQNWSQVQEVLNGLTDAHGYSLRENERTMEAYQKKVESLRMAMTELAVVIGEAGLLDIMKGLVDGIREGIEAFRELPQPVQDAIITLVGFTAALAGINLTMRVFMGIGIGRMFIDLAARIAGVEAATLGLSAALRILAANPVVMAITAISALAGAVAFYNKHANQAEQTTQTNTAAMMQENMERQRQAGILKDAIRRRGELVNALESEKLSEEQAKQAKQELNDITELTKIVLGDEAAARLEAAGYTEEAIRQELNAFEGKAQAEKEALEHTVQQQIKQTEAVVENAKQRVAALEAEGAAIKGILALEKGAASVGSSVYGFQAASNEKAAKLFDMVGLDGLAEKNREAAKAWREMEKERENSYQRMVDSETERQKQAWEKILVDAQSKLLDLRGKGLDLSGVTGTLGINGLGNNNSLGGGGGGAGTGGTGGSGGTSSTQKATSILDQAPSDVRNMIIYASQVTGVPAEVIAAIAKQESGFRKGVKSPAGAIGVMQLMPGTARGLGVDPYNAQENIIGGARYYQQQLQKYNNDAMLALAAYNAGPGNVDKAIQKAGSTRWELLSKFLPGDTKSYVPGVMKILQNAGGGSGGSGGGAITSSGIDDPLFFLQQYEEQIKLTDLTMQQFATTEQLLTNAIGDQCPTVVQAKTAYVNWGQHINALQEKQKLLTAENEAISIVISKTGDATGELTYKFMENKNAILQSQVEVDALKQKMEDFEQSMKDMQFDEAMEHFQHQVNMARINVAQQIRYIDILMQTHELSIDKQWQLEEQKFNLYRRKLDEQMDEIKEAYQERIKLIDEEANAEIEAIQRKIDALDEEKKLDDREEARREHEEKIQELLEEQQYHELRTGVEHEEALADIKKQIEEENRRWEQQQRDWQRQEEKENLQKQINDVREAAKEKKEELEDYYEEAMDIMDDAAQDMLASLAATDGEWYEQGRNWAEMLAEGLRDGNLDQVQRAIDEMRRGVGDAEDEYDRQREDEDYDKPPSSGGTVKQPIAVISRSQYDMDGNTAIMSSRTLASKLGTSASWNNTTKKVIIGGETFTPVKNVDGVTYVSVRQVAQALGYTVDFDDSIKAISVWPKAHTGAYVAQTGFAELLKGERVLPPRLTVTFDRLANVLASIPNAPERIGASVNMGDSIDRLVAVLEKRTGVNIDTLFRAEKVDFEDEADMQILSRSLAREVRNLSVGRG